MGDGDRLGGTNSLDVGDVHVAEEAIELVHRPDNGTHLKNGSNGERPVAVTSSLAEVVTKHIANSQLEKTDDSDQEPLFTSRGALSHLLAD